MIVNVIAIWFAVVLLLILWIGAAGTATKRADEVAARACEERARARQARCERIAENWTAKDDADVAAFLAHPSHPRQHRGPSNKGE